jgi:hypothetical protein
MIARPTRHLRRFAKGTNSLRITRDVGRSLYITVVTLVCSACAGSSPTSPSPSSATLIVSDSSNVPHYFQIGRTYALRATLRQPGAPERDVTAEAEWTSSDTAVATVSGPRVYIRGVGEVEVTTRYNGASGIFHISVTPGQILFEVSPLVSAEDDALIRRAMDDALGYFAVTFGWTPTNRITVRAVPASTGPTARTTESTIQISVRTPTWTSASATSKRQIVTHEFFHSLQLSTGWQGSPVWLVEGTAEYVGFRAVIIDPGIQSLEQVRSCRRQSVNASLVPVPPVAELEGDRFYTGTHTTYDLGFLAAEDALAGKPLSTLFTFGPLVQFPNWQRAFETVFWRSVGEFYRTFEEARRQWGPSAEGRCAI